MFIIKRLPEFDEWFEGLRDRITSICLGVRLDKLQRGILGKRGSIHRGARSLELGGLRRWFSCKYLDICCINRLAAHPNSSAAHPRELIRASLGDVKPVGDGVFEMREFFGPGWRMYYVQHGAVLIVMLGGGDKSREAQINSSWRAITRIGRSAALLFLQITRYLLQKPPCSPSQFERRASTRINPRSPR